jgi:hypothetical protein
MSPNRLANRCAVVSMLVTTLGVEVASAAHPPAPSTPVAPPAQVAPPAPVAAQSRAADAGPRRLELRDLEARLDALADQVRGSRARIGRLGDAIFATGDAGAHATVRFQNELTEAFVVTKVLVVLDGAVQYRKAEASGVVAEHGLVPIFEGSIQPGEHTIQLVVNLQGNGFGVFSYLRGYAFEVRSTHSFTAVEGKSVDLDIVSFEKGTVTTPLEERPTVRYGETFAPLAGGGRPPPAAGAVSR